MELTDKMLIRIAGQITELRIQYTIMRQVLIQSGANAQELDRVTTQALHGTEFQKALALVVEALRGGH